MNRAIAPISKLPIAGAAVAAIGLFISSTAMAQEATFSPPSSDYVSRAEYDKLRAEHEAMKQELEALKTAVHAMANGTAPAAPAEGPAAKTAASEGKQVVTSVPSQAATDELRQEVDTLKTQVK